MRILLGADFHLGARQSWLGPLASSRRDDLLRSLVRWVDFALNPANRIDLAILLGDLFDHHAPHDDVVNPAFAQIERLLAGRCPVAAIPGTHDGYGYPDSVYRSGRWPSGAVLWTTPQLSRRTIDVKGEPVHLYGLAYDGARTPADVLSSLAKDPAVEAGRHVAMIHGSVPASPEWEYRRRDLPVPTADLEGSGLDLVAMGHYHNFMEKRFGRTTVVYPGTLEGLKYSETGVRSFAVAVLGENGATIERTPYPGREIVDETIDLDRTPGTIRQLEEEILSRAGRDRIARFRLTGHAEVTLDAGRLAARLGGDFFHLAIDDRTVRVDGRWAERLAGERTVRGLFVRKMNARIQAAPEGERPLLEAALRAGLAEFSVLEGPHGD
jgi:DNA repair protein SbcD/Mre11